MRISRLPLAITAFALLSVPASAAARQVKLVVGFSGATPASFAAEARTVAPRALLGSSSNALDAQELSVPAGSAAAVEHSLRAQPGVSFVEPVVYFQHEDAFSPNDPFFTSASGQWYLGQLNVPAAWNLPGNSTGEGVRVAVVDSGVDAFHPDLAGKVLPGYDVPTGEYGQVATDDIESHGTMIAGLIAGVADNGQGIAGVAPQAQIIPVKIDDGMGNDSSFDLARGIVWAANDGAKVINVSLGSTYDARVVHEAVRYAVNKGAVVVCAAGNHDPGESTAVSYPAAYPESVAVGAVDNQQRLAPFSNVGSSLDVVAPGVSIVSTVPQSVKARGYDVEDGTSFASPIVAGVAALLAGRGLTEPEIVQSLVAHAHDLGNPGIDSRFGAGEVDALASLQAAQQGPPAHAANSAPSCLDTSASPLVDLVAAPGTAVAVPVLCTDADVDPFTLGADPASASTAAGTFAAATDTPFTGTLIFTASPTFTGTTLGFTATDGVQGSGPASLVLEAPLSTVSPRIAAGYVVTSLRKHLHAKPRFLRNRCRAVNAQQQECNVITTLGKHGVGGTAYVSEVAIGTTERIAVEFDGFNATRACVNSDAFPDCASPISWSD